MAREDDAEALLAIYAPHIEHGFTSFEFTVPSVAEFRERIRQTLRTHPWIIAEESGRITGYAYGSTHRTRAGYQWSCDVSVYVDPDCHRRGVGRELYTVLLALLRAQGFVNAYAGIALPNPASVALHERLGFQPIGVYRGVGYKHGKWHDVGWWSLALAPQGLEPPPPRAFADLDPDEIDATLASTRL